MGNSIAVLAPIIVLIFYLLLLLVIVITSLISSIFQGALIGAIPLMCGFLKKKKGMGFVGFAVSFILFWFNGLVLAQIAAAIFTFLIVKDNKEEKKEEIEE